MRIRTCLFLAVLFAPAASAQKSEPQHVYLFPAGGQQGTQTKVTIHGENVTTLCDFHLSPGTGVTAPPQARDRQTTLTVRRDAPLGPVQFRIATFNGGVGSRVFVVGDLPEVNESEAAGAEKGQSVTLPVTVNGRCNPDGDRDRYVVQLRAGEPFSADVLAARLGGPIDTNVFAGQFGGPSSDPTCSVLDATLRLYGPDGRVVAQAEDTYGLDPAVDYVPTRDGTYVVEVHHLAHLGMPQFVYRLSLKNRPLPRLEMSGPVEVEPNDTLEAAKSFPDGGVVYGRFSRPGDVDVYRATLAKGAHWRFEGWVERIGAAADAELALIGPDGKTLATTDDGADGSRDPVLHFAAPADGEYAIRLRDAGMSSLGDRLTYRLEAQLQPADFRLDAKTELVDLAPGGKAVLDVAVQRLGGFAGPVRLTAEGLPEGVTVEPLELAANQNAGKLSFVAAADGPSGSAAVKLVGVAAIGDGEARRGVRAPVANPADWGAIGSAPRFVDPVLVTVKFPSPFEIEADDYYHFLNLGTIVPAKVFVKRKPGFTAPIHLSMADRQPRNPYGVTFEPLTVTTQESTVFIPMRLPQGPRGNEIIRAHVKGEALTRDARGREWHISVTSVKNTVARTQAPVLSLAVEPEVLRVRRSESVAVRFVLGRTATSQGPAEIRAEPGAGMQGVTMDPVRVPPGSSEGEGMLRVAPDGAPGKDSTVWFEVTSRRENGQVLFYRAKAELDLR